MLAGIHYRADCEQGLITGARVGDYAVQRGKDRWSGQLTFFHILNQYGFSAPGCSQRGYFFVRLILLAIDFEPGSTFHISFLNVVSQEAATYLVIK